MFRPPGFASGRAVASPIVSDSERRLRAVYEHPVIAGVLVGCTLAGLVVGVAVFPEDWTLVRRLAGGAVSGAGVGLLLTAPRIIG